MQRHLILFAACAVAIGVADAETLSANDFAQLKRDAKKAIKSGEWEVAAQRLRDVARDDSKRAVEFLCDMARVPDADVYEAAKQGIAGMSSSEALDHIAKTADRGGPVDKMLLIDALAVRGDDFAAEALRAAVQAKQPEVQRAAINAIRTKKLLKALDGVISLLERLDGGRDEDGLNANLARSTLEELTGESFATAADWRNYWEPRKASFARPVTGDERRAEGGTHRRERPRFFGSELKSNRLVFVIDVSGSMTAADAPGGTTQGGGRRGGPGAGPDTPEGGSRVRIERAKEQLTQVIDALPDDARFTIMAYSGVLVRGPNGPQLPPGSDPDKPLPPELGGFEWLKVWSPKLQSASSRNKEKAKEFVAGLQANGGTFTFNAIRAALDVDGADTIVVLSDGMPNDFDPRASKEMDQDTILEEVATLNRFKRRVIDTFGFDSKEAGAASPLPGGFGRGSRGRAKPAGFGPGDSLGQFMQKLAEQNGGEYTQIK